MSDKRKSVTDEAWGYEGAGKTKTQACLDFLYDGKKGTFLGRTGKSWGLIGLFYLIYYTLLAAWWIGLLYAFFATTTEERPSWVADNGIIGANPGLGFRPHPVDVHKDNSLLWIKPDEDDQAYWKEATDKFLAPYKVTSDKAEDKVEVCNDSLETAPEDKACSFTLNQLGNVCTEENYYGYNTTSPCAFLKLNKIYDWKPTVYKKEEDLPSSMPKAMKKVIKDSKFKSLIWVWCDGQNPADREAIGEPKYFPYQGFHTKYYPFKKTPGYRQPLIAVHFEGLKRHVVVNVECKLWWPEVKHSAMDRMGMVRFQLLVD